MTSNYCVVINKENKNVLVGIKNITGKFLNGRRQVWRVVNNPGQHVFPGGDKPALTEFLEETGVDLELEEREELYITNSSRYTVLYVLLSDQVFQKVFFQVHKNLSANSDVTGRMIMATTDDELSDVFEMTPGDASRKFLSEDQNVPMSRSRTEWFSEMIKSLGSLPQSDFKKGGKK
jgi:hypothetical protein